MYTEYLVSIPVEDFADAESFRLLAQSHTCPNCQCECHCEGYDQHHLIYSCPQCFGSFSDHLGFEPLFAAEIWHALTVQHYEITCPYCQSRAQIVGGDNRKGLFFVCRERCHLAFSRTIRRF